MNLRNQFSNDMRTSNRALINKKNLLKPTDRKQFQKLYFRYLMKIILPLILIGFIIELILAYYSKSTIALDNRFTFLLFTTPFVLLYIYFTRKAGVITWNRFFNLKDPNFNKFKNELSNYYSEKTFFTKLSSAYIYYELKYIKPVTALRYLDHQLSVFDQEEYNRELSKNKTFSRKLLEESLIISLIGGLSFIIVFFVLSLGIIETNSDFTYFILVLFLLICVFSLFLLLIGVLGLVFTQKKENKIEILTMINYLKAKGIDVSDIEVEPIIIDSKVVTALEKYVKINNGEFLIYTEKIST